MANSEVSCHFGFNQRCRPPSRVYRHFPGRCTPLPRAQASGTAALQADDLCLYRRRCRVWDRDGDRRS